MNKQSTPRAFVLPAFIAVSALLGACADGGRLAAYRADPTPNMDALSYEREPHNNRDTMTVETNGRALHDDSARFWLMERPSRLTPMRVPY